MTKNQITKRKLKKLRTFDSFLKERLKDPKFKKAYMDSKPQFDLIKVIIQRRIDEGLTQKQLAKKLGTKQSAISRFESGGGNPTISSLSDMANVLGRELKIEIVKRRHSSVL